MNAKMLIPKISITEMEGFRFTLSYVKPCSRSANLFLPVIGQIVLDIPGLAAIGRALAELPYFVRTKVEELQVAFEFCAVRLRNFIGIEIHDAVIQIAIKMDHAALTVHPELLPSFEVGIVDVVTLAGIARVSYGNPVFPNDAITDRALDVAKACWSRSLGGYYIPIAHPEIKLSIFCSVIARSLIMLCLLN